MLTRERPSSLGWVFTLRCTGIERRKRFRRTLMDVRGGFLRLGEAREFQRRWHHRKSGVLLITKKQGTKLPSGTVGGWGGRSWSLGGTSGRSPLTRNS